MQWPLPVIMQNDLSTATIHNRMPAIIRPDDYATRLAPGMSDVKTLQGILDPYAEHLMEAYAISRKVSNLGDDGPDLIEPAGR